MLDVAEPVRPVDPLVTRIADVRRCVRVRDVVAQFPRVGVGDAHAVLRGDAEVVADRGFELVGVGDLVRVDDQVRLSGIGDGQDVDEEGVAGDQPGVGVGVEGRVGDPRQLGLDLRADVRWQVPPDEDAQADDRYRLVDLVVVVLPVDPPAGAGVPELVSRLGRAVAEPHAVLPILVGQRRIHDRDVVVLGRERPLVLWQGVAAGWRGRAGSRGGR